MDEAMDEVRDVWTEALEEIEMDTTHVERLRKEIRVLMLEIKPPQTGRDVLEGGPVRSDSRAAIFVRLIALFCAKSEELVRELSEMLNVMTHPEAESVRVEHSTKCAMEQAMHMSVAINEVALMALDMAPQSTISISIKMSVATTKLSDVGKELDGIAKSLHRGVRVEDHIPEVTAVKEKALLVAENLRAALQETKTVVTIDLEKILVLDLEKRRDSILCPLTFMCILVREVYSELKDLLLEMSKPETRMTDLTSHRVKVRPKIRELVDTMLDTMSLDDLTGLEGNPVIACPDKRKGVQDMMFPLCVKVLQLFSDSREVDTLINQGAVLRDLVPNIRRMEENVRGLSDYMKREVITISKIILDVVDLGNPLGVLDPGTRNSIIRAMTFLRFMNRCLQVEARELDSMIANEKDVNEIQKSRMIRLREMVQEMDEKTTQIYSRCMRG